MEFPPQVLIVATHASYHVPLYLRPLLNPDLLRNDNLLLKNFSDYATAQILPDIPLEQKVVCWFSRALGDPNRAPDAPDLFRDTDFGGNPLWKVSMPSCLKRHLVRTYHQAYHAAIEQRIERIEREYGRVMLLDIHDTGNLLFTPKGIMGRDPAFPQICLGNYEGETSSDKFLKTLARSFKKEFGIQPLLNHPYPGGYVVRKYGTCKRDAVQVEFGRYLYMDERTQTIGPQKMESAKRSFAEVVRGLA